MHTVSLFAEHIIGYVRLTVSAVSPPVPVEGLILYIVVIFDILLHQPAIPCRRDLLNISPVLTDGAAAVVDDSFLRCFQSQGPDPWNWNVYLFPMWCIGVLVRYCILFPLRFELPSPPLPLQDLE